MLDVWLVEKWLQRNSELDDVGYIGLQMKTFMTKPIHGLQQDERHAEAVSRTTEINCTYYIKSIFIMTYKLYISFAVMY